MQPFFHRSRRRLVVLGLRDVLRADYDLQGMRHHRKHDGLVRQDAKVQGTLIDVGPGLCRMLVTNFGEHPFHALG